MLLRVFNNHHYLRAILLFVFTLSLPRHNHHVLQTSFDPMDRQFIQLIWPTPTNFCILDRTLWKSSQLRLPAEVLLLIAQSFLPVHESCGFWDYNPLLSFCLVCKAWRPICQRKLFENVILRDAYHFDKLCNPKGATASADPLTYIHRIHFTYGHSCYKLGEVIPRLVKLSLPNLKCLEISSSNGALGSDPPAFPIHHSFRIYTSRLPTISFLKIGRFKFTCLAEFRSFIGTFGGLRRLEVESIRLGPDQQEDCRPLYGTQNQSLRVVTGDFLHANFLIPYAIHSTFWINDRRDLAEPADVTPKTISETVRETPCPALKPDAARLLVSIHKPLRDTKAEWTCMDGEKQQCTFITIFYLGH